MTFQNSSFVCHEITIRKRIQRLVKGVDWLMFFGFSILAFYFMNDVIDQFQSNKTSFSQSVAPIAKLPTVILCMEDDEYRLSFPWIYKVDVNISYTDDYLTRENMTEGKEYHLNEFKGPVYEIVKIAQFDKSCYKLNYMQKIHF